MYALAFLLMGVLLGMWILSKLVLICVGLVVAGVTGVLADKVVPGDLPGGILGAILAGWIGFVVGHKLMGDFGPSISGHYLLPGFLGAVIVTFVVELVGSKKRS